MAFHVSLIKQSRRFCTRLKQRGSGSYSWRGVRRFSRYLDKELSVTCENTLTVVNPMTTAAVLQEGVIFRAEEFVLIEKRWSFSLMHRSLIFSSRSVLSAHKEESKTAPLMMKCFEICFFSLPAYPKHIDSLVTE